MKEWGKVALILVVCFAIVASFFIALNLLTKTHWIETSVKEDNPGNISITEYCASFKVSLLSTNPVSIKIFVDGQTVYDNFTDRINFDRSIGLGDHLIRVYVTGHAFVYGKIYTYSTPFGKVNSFIIDSEIPISLIAYVLLVMVVSLIVLITSTASDN